jgi:hypothetical protein
MYAPLLFSHLGRGIERVTDVIAVASIATWIETSLFLQLNEASEWAALMMPIFGVVWLAVQITAKVVPALQSVWRVFRKDK